MAVLYDILKDYGYWGMLFAAFLSGSVFPFSSEAVMLALLAAGLDPVLLVTYASVGNVLGSMIERYLHIKKESLDKAEKFMKGRGAWMGFFAFLPILGSAITVVLGLTRANLFITIVSITLGKVIRYVILVAGVEWMI